jgi:hypothetical protein
MLEVTGMDVTAVLEIRASSIQFGGKGRPRMRRLDDVERDLKKTEVKGWEERMRDGEQWRVVVEEAKAHPGL